MNKFVFKKLIHTKGKARALVYTILEGYNTRGTLMKLMIEDSPFDNH